MSVVHHCDTELVPPEKAVEVKTIADFVAIQQQLLLDFGLSLQALISNCFMSTNARDTESLDI